MVAAMASTTVSCLLSRPSAPAGHTRGSWQQHCAAVPHCGRLTPAAAHPQLRCCAASGSSSGGGEGAPGDGAGGAPPPPRQHQLQDTIRESRQQQLAATDLLAKLLQSEDPRGVADEWVGSLDEQFFWTLNTYMTMAKKEGNSAVVGQLEGALQAAFEAKQATLRPEIQLLNRLLQAGDGEQRAAALRAPGAAQHLLSDGRYFFTLLQRMLQDVQRQQESAARAELLQKLQSIEAEAEAAAAAAAAAAALPAP